MKSIAFYNNKGGVGKTTSVINIAYEFSGENRVLVIDVDGQAITSVTTMVTMAMATAVSAFAEGNGEGGAVEGEAAFNEVVGFFATWIGRIGLVVAFVGGVMFALAIKNDDAEAKTRGLMTLASGFVVFALTLSLDLFGITA